jgi:hypothetical protein
VVLQSLCGFTLKCLNQSSEFVNSSEERREGDRLKEQTEVRMLCLQDMVSTYKGSSYPIRLSVHNTDLAQHGLNPLKYEFYLYGHSILISQDTYCPLYKDQQMIYMKKFAVCSNKHARHVMSTCGYMRKMAKCLEVFNLV